MTTTNSWPVRALLAGAATGARSASAIAACARTAPGGRLRARPVQAALTVGQVGEVVGDKLPQTPSRLEAPGLAARLVVGALVGGIVAARAKGPRVGGAAVGLAASVATSFVGARARAALAARFGTDLPGAVIEDAAAFACAAAATRRV